MSSESSLELVLFSLNDGALMAANVEALAQYSLPTRVFLDSRTTSSEREILFRAGIDHQIVENPLGNVAEGMYEGMLAHINSEWVFILNVDEWPSPKLISEAITATRLSPPHIKAFGVPRRWVRFDSHDQLQVSRLPRLLLGDFQWRIFRPKQVELRPVIHTPGFDRTEATSVRLSRSSSLYHFDWIVSSEEVRERKLEYYETQSSRSARRFKDYYLPEKREWLHFFKRLNDERLEGVARAFSEASSGRGWL